MKSDTSLRVLKKDGFKPLSALSKCEMKQSYVLYFICFSRARFLFILYFYSISDLRFWSSFSVKIVSFKASSILPVFSFSRGLSDF